MLRSNSFHDVLYIVMDSVTHTPVATNRDTWLPPSNASLPNKVMVSPTMVTSTMMGMSEIDGEGNFVLLFSISDTKVNVFYYKDC